MQNSTVYKQQSPTVGRGLFYLITRSRNSYLCVTTCSKLELHFDFVEMYSRLGNIQTSLTLLSLLYIF